MISSTQATPCTYYNLEVTCPHCKDTMLLCPPDGHPEYLECCDTCGRVFTVPADDLPEGRPSVTERALVAMVHAVGSLCLLALGLGGFFLLAMLME